MKKLIHKLYARIEKYFIIKWWERKIDNEMKEVWVKTGTTLNEQVGKDHRWAIGFESIKDKDKAGCKTVTIYETDWGKATYTSEEEG